MALVKRIASKTKSCYIIQTLEHSFLLDCPAEIYGANMTLPSFSRHPKPLRLILPVLAEDIDSILVTRPDSLGVLFLDRDIPVYITEPVLEQMLMKFKELSALAVHYDEEQTSSVPLSSADPARLLRNVRPVRFGEICEFNDILVTPHSAGTFVGWANYLIELEDRKTLYYVTSLSNRPRLSAESPRIFPDYLVINVDDVPNSPHQSPNQIDGFSTYIQALDTVAIIPVDMTTLLVEIVIHILFLVQQSAIPIYIASPVFNHLHTTVNIESDWMSSAFSGMKEPFPAKTYRHLHVVDSLSQVLCSGPAIVLCNPLEYALLPIPGQVISINGLVPGANHQYSLKMEMSSREITAGCLSTVVHDIVPNQYLYIEAAATHCLFEVDGSSVQLHKNAIHLHGSMTLSDEHSASRRRMEFHQQPCMLSALFSSRFFVQDDAYYFPDRNIKVLIVDGKVRIEEIK